MSCDHCERANCEGCTCIEWAFEARYVTVIEQFPPQIIFNSKEEAKAMKERLNAGEEIAGVSDTVQMNTKHIAVFACECCEKMIDSNEYDVEILSEMLGDYLASDEDVKELIIDDIGGDE